MILTALVSGALVGGAFLIPSGDVPAGDPAKSGAAGLVAPQQPNDGVEPANYVGDGHAGHSHGPGPGKGVDRRGAKGGLLDSPALAHEVQHNDPDLKNSISRSVEGAVSTATADPTTPRQAATARMTAALQRREPSPTLTTTRLQAPRYRWARGLYEMAGGCYRLQSRATGRWVRRTPNGLAATARSRAKAAPLRFQATDLGSYLLYGTKRDQVAHGSGRSVIWAGEPSPSADWRVRRSGRGFTFRAFDKAALRAPKRGPLVTGKRGTRFALRLSGGCARYPEVGVNVTGKPFAGEDAFQQATGFADAHTHGMAFEFLGGAAHCGRPWSRYGAPYALVDCPDHSETDGKGAVLESFLSGKSSHDPVGWPTFRDWPAPRSLTHEGTYYKWVERAWRGGLRVFTNLLVENNQLCQLYPIKSQRVLTENPQCKDMISLRWQAEDMVAFQRYVDAQYGGPGRGWYRIVRNPFQARRVINAGKLAVIMGIETSVPFGCTIKPNPVAPDKPIAQCSKEEVDQQLAMVRKWGVRQMELVNKFDNAFSGIAGDAGATGVLVNSANQAETGSAWRMEHCDGTQPPGFGDEVHDKDQSAAPPSDNPFPAEQQDAFFGAVAQVSGLAPAALPVYPPPHHCNRLGLSGLGQHMLRQMAKTGILFDPDHMSVKARQQSLTVMERLRYPGVLSSHSWSTPDAYPRILKLGGFIAPYAGDSTGFVDKWRRLQTWTDDRYFFGVGYGADTNGLGAQGDPRGTDVSNPVTYPFRGLGGVTVRKQRSGKRVYDINADGVAHYGLYPDWVEDLRKIGGKSIVTDMARGAEAYLQTWERAVGISPDGCRNASARKPLSVYRDLRRGMSTTRVLRLGGQPNRRLDSSYTYCAKRPDGSTQRVRVEFDDRGRLVAVRL